jgi:glucose/mannose-6-phosphate isomerase
VVLGLGGSAIGADIVSAATARLGGVPIDVMRGFAAPRLDERTLLIASSFSGNTTEVIEAFEAALDQPGMRLALSTGGRLAELAATHNLPLQRYDDTGPPRTALGYGVFPLLTLLERLGAVPDGALDATAAIAGLDDAAARWGIEVPHGSNPAKQLATALHGRVPVVLGPDFLAPAARRWANQLSENAKQWAIHADLPEATHNLIAGLGKPEGVSEILHGVLLDDGAVHPRVRRQAEVTAELLTVASIPHTTIDCGDGDRLAVLLRACYLGDWVSYYAAMLNGVDPHPTPELDIAKRALVEGEAAGSSAS